jgi:hypothetical protein
MDVDELSLRNRLTGRPDGFPVLVNRFPPRQVCQGYFKAKGNPLRGLDKSYVFFEGRCDAVASSHVFRNRRYVIATVKYQRSFGRHGHHGKEDALANKICRGRGDAHHSTGSGGGGGSRTSAMAAQNKYMVQRNIQEKFAHRKSLRCIADSVAMAE